MPIYTTSIAMSEAMHDIRNFTAEINTEPRSPNNINSRISKTVLTILNAFAILGGVAIFTFGVSYLQKNPTLAAYALSVGIPIFLYGCISFICYGDGNIAMISRDRDLA